MSPQDRHEGASALGQADAQRPQGSSASTGRPDLPSADEALARLRHELAHPPFHAFLAPEAVLADPANGEVRLRIPYRPEFRRATDMGDIHGGVLAALIDIAAHAAVAVRTGRMAPTIDLRIDYLRPATAGDLHVTARTLRVGRAIARVDVEIRGSGPAVFAAGRGTFSTLNPNA